MLRTRSALLAIPLLALFAWPAAAQDAAATIESTMKAAPPAVSADATIMDWEGNTLREGTNGWVCYPTPANIEGDAPMCLDEAFANWAQAYMTQGEPSFDTVGIGYMMAGDTGASLSDPYASGGPDEVEDWIDSGSHIMVVVPDAAMLDAYDADPESGGPYVMWGGTPYAHLMIPLGE